MKTIFVLSLLTPVALGFVGSDLRRVSRTSSDGVVSFAPRGAILSPLRAMENEESASKADERSAFIPTWWAEHCAQFKRAAATAGFIAAAAAATVPVAALAADYGSLTPEQKAVAEAWRIVDNAYLDRTFGGQDWFAVRQNAVKKKYKSMAEAQAAIADMCGQLGDKYTRYLTPAKYQSLVDSATGTLAGIGVQIAMNKDGSRVVVGDVEPDSPAMRAGLKTDDVFISGDGTQFDSKSTPDDVALTLRGPEGSKVGVLVERDGKQIDFIVTREPIKVTTVRSYMENGKVGVIRIKSFSGTTAQTVSEKLSELRSKGARSFVLDLRGNPGGLLPGGVDTASLFLEANQPLVFVVSNKGIVDSQQTFTDGADTSTPVVILVDHNTASAAEVFTAALQENGRAKVVGEQTFGKGIIQTIRPLSENNGGLAVTVARYETPKHNDINKSGIPVDIKSNVECAKDDAVACLPSNVL